MTNVLRNRFAAVGLFLIGGIVAQSGEPATAASAEIWTVIERNGDVTRAGVNHGSAPSLNLGDKVSDGDAVRTGADGHLVLAHQGHSDTLTASPNSRFQIPAAGPTGTLANVIQTLGTLLFKIEHTPGRRFEVDGPYLAAVVKGTVFTVDVGASGGSVHVVQGAVEVHSPAAHSQLLIHPGQSAIVSGLGKHKLSLEAKQSLAAPAHGAIGRTTLAHTGGADFSGNAATGKGPSKTVTAGTGSTAGGTVPRPGPALTTTIGETHLDVGALTNHLVKNNASFSPANSAGSAGGTGPNSNNSQSGDGTGGTAGSAGANSGVGVSPISAANSLGASLGAAGGSSALGPMGPAASPGALGPLGPAGGPAALGPLGPAQNGPGNSGNAPGHAADGPGNGKGKGKGH